jgi:hypothetical protein
MVTQQLVHRTCTLARAPLDEFAYPRHLDVRIEAQAEQGDPVIPARVAPQALMSPSLS